MNLLEELISNIFDFHEFQILPHKLSEKSFWVKVQEDQLASPEILKGLAQKFSSKPSTKKIDDVVDKYAFEYLETVVFKNLKYVFPSL